MNFWSNLDTPTDFFIFSLGLGVVFVNGFTDAPSAIQSSVKSRSLSLWQALILSGIFNFLGVIISSRLFFSVGKSVSALSGVDGVEITLACLITVILVGALTWIIKMPSSESHALLFSLLGASACFSGEFKGAFKSALTVTFCMIFSSVLAYFFSRFFLKTLSNRAKIKKKGLIFSTCALSFMHGAQDGQKLIAVLLIALGSGAADISSFPFSLALTVGGVMCISTVLSGKRILSSIDKLSEKTDTSSGFFSDIASFFTLLICSLLGMPISTGNVKSASVFGTEKSPSLENKRVITRIFLTSIITLPVSFLLGLVICKIILSA